MRPRDAGISIGTLPTGPLNAIRVAAALLDYMLALPGNEKFRFINPVAGETNDGALNDIRARAIQSARDGKVDEGSVGVLVQSNFGGRLTINGVPWTT